MLLHFMITYLLTVIAMGSLQSSNITMPGCPAKCGDVTVPYPFGIGTNCSLDYDFYLICNTSSDSRHKTPQLFHGPSETRIHNISDSEVRIFTGVAYKCYDQHGNVYSERSYSSDLRGIYSIFGFSEKNNFTVIGCDDDYDFYRDIDNTIQVSCNERSCSSVRDALILPRCPRRVSLKDTSIRDASITVGLENYNLTFESDQNHTGDPCGYAFLGEQGSYGVRDLSNNASSSEVVEGIESTVPVVLDWSIPRSYPADVCQENSERYGVEMGGYRCKCINGYQGNAYLKPGCQDINECEDPQTYPCDGTCNNTRGSYNCTCLHGYVGDAKTQHGCQQVPSKFPTGILISGGQENEEAQEVQEAQEVEEVEEVQVQRRRLPNRSERKAWTPAEEVALAQDWVQISTCKTVGNEQSREGFWKRILEHFRANIGDTPRTTHGLNTKWKSLNAEMGVFNGLWIQQNRLRESGCADIDVMTNALADYQTKHDNKVFGHIDAWQVVRKENKWLEQPDIAQGSSSHSDKQRKSAESGFYETASNDDFVIPDLNDDTMPRIQKRKGKKVDTDTSSKGSVHMSFEDYTSSKKEILAKRAEVKNKKDEMIEKMMETKIRIMEEKAKFRALKVYQTPHDHITDPDILETVLAEKRELAEKYGWRCNF